MSFPPSSHDHFPPNQSYCSLAATDLHHHDPVVGNDLVQQRHGTLSVSNSPTVKPIHVSLPELELNHSGLDKREHRFTNHDDAYSCTKRQQLNRPDVRSSSRLPRETNRQPPGAAHRSGLSKPNQQNPRGNFPKKTVQILQSWLEDHDYPYLDDTETGQLVSLTGLTTVQVRGWFTRHRKRKLGRTPTSHEQRCHSPEDSTTQVLADADGSIARREPLASNMEAVIPSPSLHENRRQSSSPLDDYLNASPRDGSILRCTAIDLQDNPPSFLIYRPDHSTVRPESDLPTITSEFGRSNQLSSQQSGPSVLSGDTAGRSKGKKGQRIIPSRPAARERQGNEKFQCTTCSRGFRYRSDWARHEAVHNPPEIWICTHGGPRVTIAGDRTCAFCGEPNPTDEHLNSEHNASPCFEKPTQQRYFGRPDGLLRHMKDSHNASVKIPPNSWMVPNHENGNQQFWCGFCSIYLRTTWKSRLNHIGDHYTTDDCDMTRWISESSLDREFSNESMMFSPAANPDSDGTQNFGFDNAANPEFDSFNGAASLEFDDTVIAGSNSIGNFDFEYPDFDT